MEQCVVYSHYAGICMMKMVKFNIQWGWTGHVYVYPQHILNLRGVWAHGVQVGLSGLPSLLRTGLLDWQLVREWKEHFEKLLNLIDTSPMDKNLESAKVRITVAIFILRSWMLSDHCGSTHFKCVLETCDHSTHLLWKALLLGLLIEGGEGGFVQFKR